MGRDVETYELGGTPYCRGGSQTRPYPAKREHFARVTVFEYLL